MNKILVLGLLSSLAATAPAYAQDGDGSVTTDSGGGGGGGRGLGAQIEASFVVPNGTGGSAGLVYDLGNFRIGGGLSLGVTENQATNFGMGLNAFFALHRTRNADFSIGGGVGLNYLDVDRDPVSGARGGDARIRVLFEFGGQIRAFIVQNVALMAGLGLGLSVGSGGFEFGLGGRLVGNLGVAYFF